MEQQFVSEKAVAPQVSLIQSLIGIFVEPGSTFESMKLKPKFLIAGILSILMFSVYQVSVIQKVGFKNIVKAEINGSPFTDSMSKEDKEKIIESNSQPVFEYVRYVVSPIVLVIMFLIGGLIYWLAANAMGGSMTFAKGLSVWVYSSLPFWILFWTLNLIVLLIKTVDDIDPVAASQKGLVTASPAMLIDGKSMPLVATLLGSIDLFQIWGVVLAAIGLRIMGGLSNVSAWSIVITLWVIGLIARIIMTLITGNPA
jgi:Yip1 domain